MALTSTPTDLRTESVYWAAACSNKSRTIDECKAETDATVARILQLDLEPAKQPADYLAPILNTVFMNRGHDLDFVELMLIYESKLMMEEGITICINEKNNTLRDKYIAAYLTKYGETKELLLLKLSYLSLFDVYPNNIAEVERILSLLDTPAETTV